MEQSPSRQANTHSVTQNLLDFFFSLLCSLKQATVLMLSHMNPAYIITRRLRPISILSIHFRPGLASAPSLQAFDLNSVFISYLFHSYYNTCLAHSMVNILICFLDSNVVVDHTASIFRFLHSSKLLAVLLSYVSPRTYPEDGGNTFL